MLDDYIYWTACSNLLVKSQINSSSCLRTVCKEMKFLFCHIEQRYCNTNPAHSSLNWYLELRESLWNQAKADPCKLAENTLHNRWSLSALSIIA